MRLGLAEAEAGIDDNALRRDARGHARIHPRGKGIVNIIDDIRVARIVLHVARLPLHVHHDHGHIRLRDDGDRVRVVGQRAHIVHQDRTGFDRRAHHPRPARVDRDGDAMGHEPFDHGQHAHELRVGIDRIGTGPCGLAAHVDDVRARGEERAAERDRLLRHGMVATVREAVGRHVAHAQDPRPPARAAHGEAGDIGARPGDP